MNQPRVESPFNKNNKNNIFDRTIEGIFDKTVVGILKRFIERIIGGIPVRSL